MTFLQMSLSAGVMMIILIFFIRTLFLNKLPRLTFPILWLIVLIRLIFPFSLETTFSLTDFMLRPFGINTSVSVPNVSALTSTPSFLLMSYDTGEIESTVQPSIDWLFISWILGVSLFVAFFIFNYWKSHQKISCAIPIQDEVLNRWKSEHQLKRPIQILTSDKITTPLTIGILKPKIVIPVEMDPSEKSNFEYILEHEFHHIKRWDALWKILTIGIACLHWFNPLVWVMCILANRDLEISCDGWVMKKFGKNNKKVYACILIKMAEQKGEFVPFYSGFAKHAVEERIESIMKTKKATWTCVGVAALLIGVLTLNAFATSADDNEEFYELEVDLIEPEEAVDFDWDVVDQLDSAYWLNYIDLQDGEVHPTGELLIPSIDARIPIFHGVGEPNITIGAGTMNPEFVMGEGNITLSSHWDPHPEVRFGGLHLVDYGDLLILRDADYLYIYETIITNYVIEPYRVDIIDYVEGKIYLTLFTCTPDGDQRLMVRGEFVERVSIEDVDQVAVAGTDYTFIIFD